MSRKPASYNEIEIHPGDWADKASRDIFEDFEGRSGVGNALEEVDDEIREEIRSTMAAIIRAASKGVAGEASGNTAPECGNVVQRPKEDVFVPDKRIRKSMKTFIEANSTDFNHYVLKDALVDLLEGVMSHDAKQVHVVSSAKGIEIRARIGGKQRVLHQSDDATGIHALCATIVAGVKDRNPYISGRPFASIITKASIDPLGVKFPDSLELVQVSIEPLSGGTCIDMKLHLT
jgi:hypothetical protein